MSDQEQLTTEDKVDKKTFKKQVDQFVKHHRGQQKDLLKKNQRRDLTLADMIKRSPPLADDAVDVLFGDGQQVQVPKAVIDEVTSALKMLQGKINALDQKRRFYILETFNFFSSKIGINKLIPALIILSGDDQKKAICEFIFPTFFSIQKNIETLVGCDEIFNPETIHIDRGELYVFMSDISRIAIRLFKPEFISRTSGGHTILEFLSTAFNPASFQFNKKFSNKSEFVYQEMIDDEDSIRAIVLEFIVAIQSHESLYNYAIKRDDYYKNFLVGLIREDRFKDVDPIDISKILAGCFMANEQLSPPEELIKKMIDAEAFDAADTDKLKAQFIDKLAPSIIFRLIGRLRVSLQHISKVNFGSEFQDIQKFSVISILKNVWSGFIGLVEKGLIVVTGPFTHVFKQMKKTYGGFVEEEKQRDDSVTSSLLDVVDAKVEPSAFLSKNLDAFSRMTQSFKLVNTSIISFRGEHEGATYKDFGFNSRLFRNDEDLMVQFLSVFTHLFQKLLPDKNVKEITYSSQRKIREYYAAYQFDQYLLCIGLTHIKNLKLPVIDEKSIFPYVLLFIEGNKIRGGNATSRLVKQKGVNKIYNELLFTGNAAKIYFEALYLILHLLPGADWDKKSTQTCIAFLMKELNRMILKKEKLLYC
ncbi:MAG: hypothetical protein HQ517_01110, partial [SAR324 cluster bacterium]|nr:hypothetical protein [SAR324 cluster bacterium]